MLFTYHKKKKIIVVGFQVIESLIKKWWQRMKNDYIEVKFEKGLTLRRLLKEKMEHFQFWGINF